MHLLRISHVLRPKGLFLGLRRPNSSVPRRRTKRGTVDLTSRDHILHRDILQLLSQNGIAEQNVRVPDAVIDRFPFRKHSANVLRNVHIVAQTAEADGLAIVPRTYQGSEEDATTGESGARGHETVNKTRALQEKESATASDISTDVSSRKYTVLKVPKTVPGDVVDVVLRRHYRHYAEADLLAVTGATSPKIRKDSLVVCGLFEKCLGCQLQMVTYEQQLAFKQSVIEKAYAYFYPLLDTRQISGFGCVVDSPMQYGYRTKLTPHANPPRNLSNVQAPWPIGFEHVNGGKPVVDVHLCPIAVPSINQTLPRLRERLRKDLQAMLDGNLKEKLALTLLLRDSAVQLDSSKRKCLTNHRQVVTETVGNKAFQFLANDFFQNNRSILPTFIDFLKYQITGADGFKHIVDAYCGCGFLGISLSDVVPNDGKVFGIEISETSIKYAMHNAGLNGLSDKVSFVLGNSDNMFTHAEFLKARVAGPESLLIINPSRKGSSKAFLRQVLQFKPRMIVYVSCNAFTQARDLNDLHELQKDADVKYKVSSVTGFDFYPQTKHVECVAVLKMSD